MAEHSGQTGQTKKIMLPSSIEQVMWSRKLAAVGGVVDLEVFTMYVGTNSEMQIELSDASGKTVGKYTERMAGTRFKAQIRVPAEAREELYATVKLPKHGLQKKSSALLVVPPVQISNAKWDKSEARSGDMLTLTANVKGAPDGVSALIQIFEHDADGAHELVTKFPATVKGAKIDADWEGQSPGNATETRLSHDTEQGHQATEYFFRITVGEVSVDSVALRVKEPSDTDPIKG